MKKPMLWVAAAAICVLILVYWFFFSQPDSFLEKDQTVESINKSSPRAYAREIQDVVAIDNKHMLVPYISKQKNYGLSYWEWEFHQWKLKGVENSLRPNIWMTDVNDPSSYRIVWNIAPEQKLHSLDFYLLMKRGYSSSADRAAYQPKIQMNKTVALTQKSYGAVPLPKEWIDFLTSMQKQNPDQLNSILYQDIQLGYIPDRELNEENIHPEQFFGSFTNLQTFPLMELRKEDL